MRGKLFKPSKHSTPIIIIQKSGFPPLLLLEWIADQKDAIKISASEGLKNGVEGGELYVILDIEESRVQDCINYINDNC